MRSVTNKWDVFKAKLLWFLLVKKRWAISNALSEVESIDAALNEQRTLWKRQSELLIDMEAYLFSADDIRKAILLYQRLKSNGLDVIEAVVALKEEDK